MVKVNPLEPEQSTHRASLIAVDFAILIGKQLSILKRFLSDLEMYHLEMQVMYVLIGLMSATKGSKPEHVMEDCKKYFERLRREQKNVEPIDDSLRLAHLSLKDIV
jgi:hypothetical protein